MAKCLRVVGQGRAVRMPDDDAFQVVDRDKDGQYMPKRTWRGEDGVYALLRGSKITTVESIDV